MYAHPTRIKHKSKDVSVVVDWIQRKMESKEQVRETQTKTAELGLVARYLMH
jgi:hypothetical protein